jgi:hypothetical protein
MVRRLTGREMDSTFQFRARQATVSGLVRDRAKRRGAAVSSKHCQLSPEKSVCPAEIRQAAAHRRMRRHHQGRVVSTSNPSPVRALASRASRDRRNGPSAQNLARCGRRIARPGSCRHEADRDFAGNRLSSWRRPPDHNGRANGLCSDTASFRPELKARGAQPRQKLAEATAGASAGGF